MVDSSPRPIAASRVLHRLLVPRHSPSALGNLTTKMLASTVQFSNNGQPRPHRHHTHPKPRAQFDEQGPDWSRRNRPPRGLFLQDSTGCLNASTSRTTNPIHTPGQTREAVLGSAAVAGTDFTSVSAIEHPRRIRGARAPGPTILRWTQRARLLLRKEVIQPHLPVRLPCYDFVPIASPTFDGSLPQGVGPPASGVADFRDVTGGVYKARERIHRSNADLRLLATPTSRGRVADPDPN